MGIFSRLGDIVSANVNDILDRAEDPAKMIRLIILEMEETLVEVRASAARTIADQKEARRTLARLAHAQTSWTEKAELALSKGREDLAKAALIEKRKLGDMAEQLTQDQVQLNEALAKHEDDIAKLEAKLREARLRQSSILARLETVENRVRIRRMMSSPKVDEAFARFDLLERRVDYAEGRIEASDLGKTKSLADEIAELETSDKIDAELNALKEKIAAGMKSDKA
jgi:phage shock protein A